MRSEIGGPHLTQAVQGNTGETISNFKIGEQRRKVRRIISQNLRSVDHIFPCTGTPHSLQPTLQYLSDERRQTGLKIIIAKTKVMVVDNASIKRTRTKR